MGLEWEACQAHREVTVGRPSRRLAEVAAVWPLQCGLSDDPRSLLRLLAQSWVDTLDKMQETDLLTSFNSFLLCDDMN